MQLTTTASGSSTYIVHTCDGCIGVAVKPCDRPSGQHDWYCFDHYGHPTGEQMCECGALRHHPDQRHSDGHFASHRVYLEDGGECWCQTTPAPAPGSGAGGER